MNANEYTRLFTTTSHSLCFWLIIIFSVYRLCLVAAYFPSLEPRVFLGGKLYAYKLEYEQ